MSRWLVLIHLLSMARLFPNVIAAQEESSFSWHVLVCDESGCNQPAVDATMILRQYPLSGSERIVTTISTDANGWAFATIAPGTTSLFVTPYHQDQLPTTSYRLTCKQGETQLEVKTSTAQTAAQAYTIALSGQGEVTCESLINPYMSPTETGTIHFRAFLCPFGYADQFYPET